LIVFCAKVLGGYWRMFFIQVEIELQAWASKSKGISK
jgi:hypothetical protein